MNIQTAMHYLNTGTSVRRAFWSDGIFIGKGKTEETFQAFNDLDGTILTPGIQLVFDDLLADDWEVYHPVLF